MRVGIRKVSGANGLEANNMDAGLFPDTLF